MKITQSPTITISALRKLAEGGEQIHIHMNTNAVQIGSNHCNAKLPEWLDGMVQIGEKELFSLINTMPEPKLDNFITYVYCLALRGFGGNKTQASKWLGVSNRNYNHYADDRGRFKKQKVLMEKLKEIPEGEKP